MMTKRLNGDRFRCIDYNATFDRHGETSQYVRALQRLD